MFDREGYEDYVRQQISLERQIAEYSGLYGSKEVESQMQSVKDRLSSTIRQSYRHATQEMLALRMIVIETHKDANEGNSI